VDFDATIAAYQESQASHSVKCHVLIDPRFPSASNET